MRFDNSGNLYFSGKPYQANPQVGLIDINTSTFTRVIGNLAASTSTDATSGNAQSKSINCGTAFGSYGCWIDKYDNLNDRIYFIEQNGIRYVQAPHDPSNSSLGTLIADVGRDVGAFYRDTVNNWVYYTSNDGKLYCYDVTLTNPANCNNTTLGPDTTKFEKISTETIETDGTYLYLLNEKLSQVLRYKLP